VNIREATAADIDAMHRIRLAVRENRLSDPGWLTAEVYRAYLADAGKGNSWVVEVDGQVAGFCVGRLAEADLWALFIDPAHEGRGLGRALLDVATRWLFARGVASIGLTTTPASRADRFYAAAGWQRGGIDAKGEVAYRLVDAARPLPQESPC
jgi:GNAT superfamily N-acetyltransferase